MLQNIEEIFNKYDGKWKNYQPVYFKGRLLKTGYRDLNERFNLIDPVDLKGKSVIEFGCNIGMNCQLSVENGATKAVGFDNEMHLIEIALDLNSFFKRNCEFYRMDLSRPLDFGKFDTGFMFAIDSHVKNNKELSTSILTNVTNVLYFETHASKRSRKIPKEISDIFSQVILLGTTCNKRRDFYKCIL